MDQVLDLLDSASKSHPIKALADELGKAESTLRNELTEQPGYKLGLRTAVLIMRKTGDLRALDRLETLFGRVAFTVPRPESTAGPFWALEAAAVKEFGEQMEAISGALRDNRITREEARKCLKEVTETIGALARIKAHLEEVAK